jgi:hypothetical protein
MSLAAQILSLSSPSVSLELAVTLISPASPHPDQYTITLTE